jgi:hypothetical protein
MTTTHAPIGWYAGDDWEIVATLLDENGTPYNLVSQEILWVLFDATGQRVLDEDDVTITITDAAEGICSIIIPAAKTSPLAGGQYSDVIRIIDSGITSTLSVGTVQVTVDPWAAPATLTLRRVS